jgi:hypothetical protein
MNQDLYNNPMVDMAKKSLTPKQLEEYKKIGEYMYNTEMYRDVELNLKTQKKSTDEEIAFYAYESLKSGLNPKELSQKEISCLKNLLGEKWYEKFDYTIDDVPKYIFGGNEKLSRQQRRFLERKMKKSG